MIAAVAADTASRTPLGGHLWHLVAGLVPLVIAVAVVLLERVRGKELDRDDYLARPAARALLSADSFGISPSRLATRPRAPKPATAATRRPAGLTLAVIALVVAAGVHVLVMPEHFEESWLYGAFFLGTASAQLGAAALVWRYPTRLRLLAIGLASVAVVVLWAWTRAVGVPLGPGAGEAESFGLLDVIASAAEVVTAIGCLAATTPLRTGQLVRGVGASLHS